MLYLYYLAIFTVKIYKNWPTVARVTCPVERVRVRVSPVTESMVEVTDVGWKMCTGREAWHVNVPNITNRRILLLLYNKKFTFNSNCAISVIGRTF